MRFEIFQKRKAISTVVGTLFFLVILIAAFTAMIAAFQLNADIFESQLEISDFENLRTREQFEMLPSSMPSDGNRLAIKITNTGANTIEIRDVFITNYTKGQNFETNRIQVDFRDTFVPIGSSTQILENQPFNMGEGLFEIKVVSKLGSIKTQNMTVPLDPLTADLHMSSSDVANGNNSTLIMFIQNKGNTTVNGVRAGQPLVTPVDSIGAVTRQNPTNVTDLEPGETVIFKWNYQLFGAVGTTTNFTNAVWGIESVTGENVTSNFPRDEVTFIPSTRSILQIPELSMIVPSPFGETGSGAAEDSGIWGVVVSNPTDIPITISRIVITMFSTNSNPIIGKTCTDPDDFTTLFPNPNDSVKWTCPAINVIQWTDSQSPIPVTPHNATVFMVKMETGSTGGGVDDPAFVITATAFSSYGQTSRSGFISGMEGDADSGLINTYLADPDDVTCCLDDTDIITGTFNIASRKTDQKFRIAVTDWNDASGSNGLAAGANILINIPSGFKNIQVLDGTGGTVDETVKITVTETLEFPDGSTQLVATTDEIIGNGGTESAYITFEADMPGVSKEALYLMFVLTEGIIEGTNFPVGTIAEVPIQIVPP